MKVRVETPYLGSGMSARRPRPETEGDVTQPEPGTSALNLYSGPGGGGESSKRRRLTSPGRSGRQRASAQAGPAGVEDGNPIPELEDEFAEEVISGIGNVLPVIQLKDIGRIIPNTERVRVIEIITLDEDGETTHVEVTERSPIVLIDLTEEEEPLPLAMETEEVMLVDPAEADSGQSPAKVSSEVAERDDVIVLRRGRIVRRGPAVLRPRSAKPEKPPHPLLNHVVLSHVMSYHTFEEHKRNRLVCKLWDSIASNKIKLRHKPLLLYDRDELERFLELIRNSDFLSFPFGSFKLNYESLGRAYFYIFPTIGPQMLSLGISFREPVTVLGGGGPYEWLVEAFRHLRNLQEIQLLCSGPPEAVLNPKGTEIDYENVFGENQAKIRLPSLRSVGVSTLHTFGLLFDLFSRAENLAKLELADDLYGEDADPVRIRGENEAFVDAFRTAVQGSRPLELTLGNDLGPDHLLVIHEAGFRFRRISITGDSLEFWEAEDLLKRFLLAQVRTLREFKVTGTFPSAGWFDPSRIFGLKQLLGPNVSVEESEEAALEVKLDPAAPTLVRIRSAELVNLLESREPVRTPDVVAVTATYTTFTGRDLSRLAYVFPSLRRLELGSSARLTSEQTEVIFTRLVDLVELKMTLAAASANSALTGLNNPTRVNNEFSRWKRNDPDERYSKMSRPELRALFLSHTDREPDPSLCNMRRLEKLELTLWRREPRVPALHHPSATLICAAVHLAFLGIPPLKELIFNLTKLAQTGRKALHDYHENVKFN